MSNIIRELIVISVQRLEEGLRVKTRVDIKLLVTSVLHGPSMLADRSVLVRAL